MQGGSTGPDIATVKAMDGEGDANGDVIDTMYGDHTSVGEWEHDRWFAEI